MLEPVSKYIAFLDHFKQSRLFELFMTRAIRKVVREEHGVDAAMSDADGGDDDADGVFVGAIQMDTFARALQIVQKDLELFVQPAALNLGELLLTCPAVLTR